jgi:hypothetical protein
MKGNLLLGVAIASVIAFTPAQAARARNDNAVMVAAMACTALQARERSFTCQVEFPNGDPALLLRFRDQTKAMAYGPIAIALLGPTLCSKVGDDDESNPAKLVLVDLTSGSANVYSCADRDFGGWKPLKMALR